MHGLQDLIHKLEEGKGTLYIKLVAAFLALFTLVVVYNIREFQNFSTQEGMDNAQLARNIAHGEGYTTDFVRPLSMYLVKEKDPQRSARVTDHPDLANPPLYPVLLAGWLKAFPFDYGVTQERQYEKNLGDLYVSWFNQICFFVAAFILYRLAKRLFDAGIAFLATAVFIGTELFWKFSISGQSTMLLIVLLLALVWCLVVMEQATRADAPPVEGEPQLPPRGMGWYAGMAALVGVLLGLGALTRYSYAWLIFPVAGFLLAYFPKRRLVLPFVAVLTFLLVFTPWLVRNYNSSGNFFGVAGYALVEGSGRLQGTVLSRSFFESQTEHDLALSQVDVGDFTRKLVVNTTEILQNDLPKLGGNWITAFFLASLLIPFRSSTLSRLRYFLIVSLLLFIAVQALGRTYLTTVTPVFNSENLLVLLAPLLFIFGVGMFTILLDQIELPFPQLRTVANGLLILVASAPLILAFFPPRTSPVAYPPYHPKVVQMWSNFLKIDEAMMSDMPWAVAWYGQRTAVWNTLDIPTFYTINDEQKTISALYITSFTSDQRLASELLRGETNSWEKFFTDIVTRTNIPKDFPLKYARPDLSPEQILLLDRQRWRERAR